MSLIVIAPGVQATLQAAPRTGQRHLGVPASGPADAVSMAIANRLVAKTPHAVAIEITHGPAAFYFEDAMHFSLCGAHTASLLDGEPVARDETCAAGQGARLDIGPFQAGARLYLALSGSIAAREDFGSASTYLPAALGGHHGRALARGDTIAIGDIYVPPVARVPQALRSVLSHSFALRVVAGPDGDAAAPAFAHLDFTVTARASRMGLEIEGDMPFIQQSGERASAAVMPGALQVTPGRRGFLLSADAQTTGGYPHVLQVIAADRHLIGQIRPGDRLRFLMRPQAMAEAALAAKQALLATWLTGFRL